MLTVRCPIHFPQLIFVKEIEFQVKGNRAPVYRLDWSKFDEYHKKQQEKQDFAYLDKSIPVADFVPRDVAGLVDSCLYVLDAKYINEINRCFRQAFEEWQKEMPFDTVIRNIITEIQQSYVYVGFKLLCDCMFNETSQYFEKSILKFIAPHALCLRFWQKYAGTWMLNDCAKLSKLNKLADQSTTDGLIVKKFLADVTANIDAFEKKRDDICSVMKNIPLKDIEIAKKEYYSRGDCLPSSLMKGTRSKNAQSKIR